jgi:CRP/FNR family transcriptional regulator
LGTARRLDAGEVLIREGRAPPFLFVVRGGLLVASSSAPGGRSVAVALLGPGEVFGEAAVADPLAACRLEVRAVAASDVLVLGPERLWEPGTDARACRWILVALARRLHRADADLTAALGLPVAHRVRHALDALAGASGRPVPGGTRITVPITQEMLAAMVGATRESVNRALGRLRRIGAVRWSGRTYTVSSNTSPPGGPTLRTLPSASSFSR